ILDDEHVAGSRLGDLASLVVEDGFVVAAAVAVLVMHDVAQQRGGLDVAAPPALVLAEGDPVAGCGGSIGYRWRRNLEGEGKQGGGDLRRIGVVAAGIRAATDVQVDAEVAIAVAFGECRGNL